MNPILPGLRSIRTKPASAFSKFPYTETNAFKSALPKGATTFIPVATAFRISKTP